MGHWAGHLVFVRWSKIQALFLPTPSKDKNIDVCICTGRLLEGHKRRGPHPISVDIPPQVSAVASILAKILGKVVGQSGVKKETRLLAKCKQRSWRTVPYKWFKLPFYFAPHSKHQHSSLHVYFCLASDLNSFSVCSLTCCAMSLVINFVLVLQMVKT